MAPAQHGAFPFASALRGTCLTNEVAVTHADARFPTVSAVAERMNPGYPVYCLRPDEIERCAHAEGLDVEVFRSGFEEFVLPGSPYDAILVFGLIPDLDRTQIAELCARVREWLRPEGLLWITGFTVEDPGFSEVARTLERIGVTSFRRADGGARTYLAREEILQIFTDFAVIHHWEGLGPEHRHGDGPVERHGRFEAVLRRGEG